MPLHVTKTGDLVLDVNEEGTNRGLINATEGEDQCCGCNNYEELGQGVDPIHPPDGSKCYTCDECCYSGICDGVVGWPEMHVVLELESFNKDDCACSSAGGDAGHFYYAGILNHDCFDRVGFPHQRFEHGCQWTSNRSSAVPNKGFATSSCIDKFGNPHSEDVGINVEAVGFREDEDTAAAEDESVKWESYSSKGSPIWDISVASGGWHSNKRIFSALGSTIVGNQRGVVGDCCGTTGPAQMYIDSHYPCAKDHPRHLEFHDGHPFDLKAGTAQVSIEQYVMGMECCEAKNTSGRRRKTCVESFGGNPDCSTCCDSDPIKEDGSKFTGLSAYPRCEDQNEDV